MWVPQLDFRAGTGRPFGAAVNTSPCALAKGRPVPALCADPLQVGLPVALHLHVSHQAGQSC